jgi:hypothetical protein
MPTTFSLPDEDDVTLLTRAIDNWHPSLFEHGVRVQVIMATGDGEKPAVTHGGYPARATVRVVPLKDRLTKGFDAEVVVDYLWWRDANVKRRAALLDHELMHLEVRMKKVERPRGYRGPDEYVVDLDDLGRPKLKLRKGDWNAGDGFADCVARHGDDAAEFENLKECWRVAEKVKADAAATA